MKREISEITGLRALAALAVLALHGLATYGYAGHAPPESAKYLFFNHGWVGVDLFFVLSGFLLALPLLPRPERVASAPFWRNYVASRWLRIAPPYYAAILLALAMAGNIGFVVHDPLDVLFHATFLHTWHLPSFMTINPVFWTLSIEFQFYLVLPMLVVLLASRWWFVSAVALTVGTLFWRANGYGGQGGASWLAFTFPAFLIHFTFGVLAARLYLRGWRLPMNARYFVPAVLVSFVALPLSHFNGFWSFSQGDSSLMAAVVLRPLLAVGFAALILGLCCGQSGWNAVLNARPMQAIGRMSYSLYLAHVPPLLILNEVWPSAGGFPLYVLAFAVLCLATSAIFYYLIEGPSTRLRQRLLNRRPRRTAIEHEVLPDIEPAFSPVVLEAVARRPPSAQVAWAAPAWPRRSVANLEEPSGHSNRLVPR